MTDDGTHQDTSSLPAARQKGASRLVGYALIAAGLAIGAWTVVSGRQAEQVKQQQQDLEEQAKSWLLPDPDLTKLEPAVATLIQNVTIQLSNRRAAPEAWGTLGMVYHVHGLPEPAEECYRHVLTLEPGNFAVHYLLGLLLDEHGGDADEVCAFFDETTRLRPDYAVAHLRKGLALQRRGQIDAARQALEKAVEVAADFDMAYLQLGRCWLDLDKPEAARTALERARELNPGNGGVHASLARVYRRLGDEAAATASEQLAAELFEQTTVPDPVLSQLETMGVSSLLARERARNRMAAGNYEGAVRDLMICRDAHPDDADLLYELGACQRGLGEVEEAEKSLQASLDLGGPVLARWQLAMLRIGQGRQAEGEQLLAEALEQWPANPRFDLDKASALCAANRHAEALELLHKLPRRSVAAHHLAAQAYIALGKPDAAVSELERALEIAPESGGLHLELADLLDQLGRTEEAKSHRDLARPRH